MNTYERMLAVAMPDLVTLLDPPDVWVTEVRHDERWSRLVDRGCTCEPEIYFTRRGETCPLARLSIVDGMLAIDLNSEDCQ